MSEEYHIYLIHQILWNIWNDKATAVGQGVLGNSYVNAAQFGNLFGFKKQMTSQHKCIIDWSNYYSNVITMLWPRSSGIQYPCFLDKSNKLPMPHVLNTSSFIRPVQQREGSRRRKRKQRSLWKCILQKMQHCSIPREKYELWNIKCPNIQMWKL